MYRAICHESSQRFFHDALGSVICGVGFEKWLRQETDHLLFRHCQIWCAVVLLDHPGDSSCQTRCSHISTMFAALFHVLQTMASFEYSLDHLLAEHLCVASLLLAFGSMPPPPSPSFKHILLESFMVHKLGKSDSMHTSCSSHHPFPSMTHAC